MLISEVTVRSYRIIYVWIGTSASDHSLVTVRSVYD